LKIHCKFDELINPKDLKTHPKNRNFHPKEQIERLAKILEYQGFRYAIKVSKLSGFITSGHGRALAAIKMGLEKVPVVYQDYDDETMEYADVLADNAIASWAELDFSGINADIGELGPDFDIDLLGIENFTVDVAEKGLPNNIPEDVEPRTKRGDLYKLGEHRLLCGDSTNIQDVEKLMNGEKADLLLTDPPYGVSYIEKNAAVHGGMVKNNIGKEIKNDCGTVEEMGALWAHLFSHADHFTDEASYYVFSPQGGELMMMMMQAIHQSKWQLKHSLIWEKQNFVFGRCDYHYQHEPVLYGWKKKGTHNWYADRSQSSLLKFDKPHKSDLHPTTKPVEILEYLICNSTKPNDKVADIFGGSGSTLIACEKTHRKCFMQELDQNYCDVIVTRWEEYTGQKDELING
jgi:DNA modification methylase